MLSRLFLSTLFTLLALTLFAASDRGLAQDAFDVDRKRNDDVKLIEGLRRRRLFELAKFYCDRQLTQPGIDPTSQSTIVIELMKTQTAAAVLSETDQRKSAWQTVETTADEFIRDNPDHPRLYLVRVQQALSHVAYGRLLQQEIAADMAEDSARELALKEIRIARTLLSDLQRDIAKAIPEQGGRSLGDHDLTVAQLMNLNNNVRYQLAVCNLNRAQLYDASDRLNRIDALNSVSARLMEVQRATSEGQPLWWKTKLGQVECMRLLGSPAEARTLVESLPAKDIPPSTLNELSEQKVLLAIELGDENYARDVLVEVEKLNARTAELDLALVELAVDLSARAGSDGRKQEWLEFAAESSRAIEAMHGGYWGRRADLVLIASVGATANGNPDKNPIKITPGAGTAPSTTNTELDLLIRTADEAYRKQRWDDALKGYDRAAAMAVSAGNVELALQLEVRAGQALENLGKHALAGQKLIAGSQRDPNITFASAAHLRGCWNLARTVKSDRPESSDAFESALQDHLRIWPAQPTANQVRVWLGHQLQQRRQWRSAFDLFLDIAIDSPQLPGAIDQSLVCASKLLTLEREKSQSTGSTAAKLISRLLNKQNQLPSSDPIAISLALAVAELELIFGSSQPSAIEIEAIQAIEKVDGPNRNRARAILTALSCWDSPEKATVILKLIQADEQALELSERCLTAVMRFGKLQEGNSNASQTRLEIIEHALKLPAVSEPARAQDRSRWLLKKSAALTATDRHAESIAVLLELEQQFPRSARIQMQLARAMTSEYGTTDPEKPLTKWRQVATRLKSHTANWFEAKYEVARLLFESGNKGESMKLLQYIQAIPPGWEASQYKRRFEELIKRCQTGG